MAGTRLDKGLARTGQQEGFDESGSINGLTKEVSTDGDDNRKDDDRDDNSGLLVMKSAMTGAASDLWIDHLSRSKT